MTVWSGLDGTSQPLFRFGLGRSGWKGVGTIIDARLTDDSNRAAIAASSIALGFDSEPTASTGNIAMRNLATAFIRNAANTGDIQWLSGTVNNDIIFGNDAGARHVDLRGTLDVRMFAGATLIGSWLTTGLQIEQSLLTFGRAVISPRITQGQLIAAGTPTNMLITAQGSNQTNTPGAYLKLGGGVAGGGTGTQGGVQLGTNDGTNLDITPLFEVFEAAVSPVQRVTGMNFAAGLTTTIVPAGAGDLVTVVANALTAPTVDAVGAFTMYGDSGRPAFRFAGCDLRIDGTSVGVGTPSTQVLNIRVNGVFYKIPLNT